LFHPEKSQIPPKREAQYAFTFNAFIFAAVLNFGTVSHQSCSAAGNFSEVWILLFEPFFNCLIILCITTIIYFQITVSCTKCTAVDFCHEFLSVELEDFHDKNLASEVKLKLQKGDEHICSTCNKVTLSWEYLSVQFPQYLIVHATK